MPDPNYTVDSFFVLGGSAKGKSFTEERKRFEVYGQSFGLRASYESFQDVYGYLQAILHSLLCYTYELCVLWGLRYVRLP
jgi:hypothetical protein